MASSSFALDLLDKWLVSSPEVQKEMEEIVARELLKNASPESVHEALQILRDDAARKSKKVAA